MTESTSGATPGDPGSDDLLPLAYEAAPPPRRRRGGCFLLATFFIVVVVLAGAAAVRLYGRINGQNTLDAPATINTAGFHAAAGSSQTGAEQMTAAFLRAWSDGDIAEAASLTDNPSAARAALAAYRRDLSLKKLSGAVTGGGATSRNGRTWTAGATAATTFEAVTFRLNASVASSAARGALSGTWSYGSSLTAYQVPAGTGWFIEWDPSVLAPNLTSGQHLAVTETRSSQVTVTDSGGHPLSGYTDSGLARIASLLAGRPASGGAGSPGLAVQIVNDGGSAVPGSQAPVTAPMPRRLATTISQRAEKAAINAVAGTFGTAIAVIQPSTGHILAIANSAQGNDFAMNAEVAPGSTMKIITATALLNSGAVTASTPVACPATETVQGVSYHNDKGGSEPQGTSFATDFAQSCNNAFDQWWKQLDGPLAQTARTYYGLDQPWNIGIIGDSATYFSQPANPSGAEVAEESFGEGQLTTSPLAMASVAATVDEGQFHQPVLLPGNPPVSADPLPASTDEQLKEMMRDVVTSGTAAQVGFGPDVYAKTGTADVQGQEQPNSWLVAFDPGQDVAIAVLALNAGYGSAAAGPEAKVFFDGY